MEKKVYITTSIPYVNASPHIGYALEAVQSDTLIRHYRQQKYDAYFLSGTDENAMKNVESAEKAGLPTKEFVDKNAQAFYELKEALTLSFDQFIRTTEEKHALGAQKIWDLCKKDIYKKTYTGLYCVGCETFYKDGEFPDNICPDHNRKLEIVSEENYFFALSKYSTQLKDLLTTKTIEVVPEFRLPEILNFIEEGLDDFSISRPAERVKKWGIPVPGDKSQYMYVWFDALTNYITALDFDKNGELYKTYWQENPNRFHVIGKNITKFHLLYWPAMLLSAGLNLPTKVYVHGFITMDGKKMSKSIGNVVDPFAVVKEYGSDAVRFYLLREIPSLDDGDFSYRRMDEIYNAELANELGNMVMRVTTLAEKDALTIQPAKVEYDAEISRLNEAYQFNLALEKIFTWVKAHNKEIDDFAPWKKTKEERREFLTQSLNTIYKIAFHLQPYIPSTAEKIMTATQGEIKKIAPLFPKKVK